MVKRSLITTAVAVAAMLGLAAPAFADRIVVDDTDEPPDCPNADTNSIEVGVETANPGDTVFVCRGTYNETVTIEADDSNIRVRGQDVDDVILDGQNLTGMGFHLTGGVTDVVVERFTVRRYFDNIVLDGGANRNRIRRNFLTGPSGHDGIRLSNAHNNLIERNDAIDNGTEVNGCGIDLLMGSSGNIVRQNFATLNDRAGIRVMGGGTGNVVRDNELRDNGRAGILNNATTGTLIVDNDARHSLGVGAAELGHGIHVLNSTGITVRDNTTDRNMADGIFLQNADTNTFRDNESEANGRDGIRADSTSTGNTIRGNEMEDNAEHDCHDDTGLTRETVLNSWIDNEGETSQPTGLCRADDEDENDDDDDDDDDDNDNDNEEDD
jgi:parallel beta-helix repeat protein